MKNRVQMAVKGVDRLRLATANKSVSSVLSVHGESVQDESVDSFQLCFIFLSAIFQIVGRNLSWH
jgi:hypothetical protein